MNTAKKHHLANKTVIINCKPDPDNLNGQKFLVEDWWIRVSGGSWMNANGNPTCLKYAMRSGLSGLPTDDLVIYGKVGHYGHLIHTSEIGKEISTDEN